MIRHMSVVAALTVSAGAASAAFIGIDIREDKTPPSADGLGMYPGDANIRLFNLYAMFDGPGLGIPGTPNEVLNVGQQNPGEDPLVEGFGINLDIHPNASFYRSPGAAGGGVGGIGGINEAGSGDNRREWNTFVSIGIKRFDSDYGGTPGYPVFNSDNTGGDDDFGFHTQGEALLDRPILQRSNWISGGWFNNTPTNLQGGASDLGDGSFGSFLGQFAIMFPAEGADLGEWGGTTIVDEVNLYSTGTWYGEIFTGTLKIFTQDPLGTVLVHDIFFEIPTPGALALFGLAGFAGLRRRR